MSTGGNGITVYLMSSEDVERLLTAKYGKKLVAVNRTKLAKQNEVRANWLKSIRERSS